jgi:hypothetical protein
MQQQASVLNHGKDKEHKGNDFGGKVYMLFLIKKKEKEANIIKQCHLIIFVFFIKKSMLGDSFPSHAYHLSEHKAKNNWQFPSFSLVQRTKCEIL